MTEKTGCSRYREMLSAYLDNEIADRLRSEVEQHVLKCDDCRQRLLEEEASISYLQSFSPLNPASPELRDKISRLLENHKDGRARWQPTSPRWIPLTGLLMVSLLFAVLIFWKSQTRPEAIQQVAAISDFSTLAVETHVRRLNQQLPLEIVSSSPEEVSQWFNGKVNFGFKLPKYPESSEEKKYYLEGARLINYKDDYGAGVSYRMEDRLITLLMIGSEVATPIGGDLVTAGNLVFHLQNYKGFHVITWSDRGLTYALVSDFEERGQQSCMVCHQDQQQSLTSQAR